MVLALVRRHAGLVGGAPCHLAAHPLVWLSYQFNVFILVWGLGLLQWVHESVFRGRFASRRAPPKPMMLTNMEEEVVVKDIVLIGAGHAHVHVLKQFGMKPERNVRITLITEGISTPYSGMLPGYVSGIYTQDECHIDVLRLAEFARARVVIARAKQVWMDSRTVEVEDDSGSTRTIFFDVLSINIGSSPVLPTIHPELVIPVKPISQLVHNVDRILTSKRTLLNLAVVGGGAGGTEMALALYHRLHEAGRLGSLTLVTRDGSLCSSHSAQFQQRLEEHIRASTSIRLVMRTNVVGVSPVEEVAVTMKKKSRRRVRLVVDGEEDDSAVYDEVVWCTQARGAAWLGSAFDADGDGFVKVNAELQVINTGVVFAAGDCAHFTPNPLPKSGVFAVRQGPVLSHNVRAVVRGEHNKLHQYKPQRTFLSLVGTHNGRLAMASKGEMGTAPAEWLWDLKEWIDRQWMRSYGPQMLPTRQYPQTLQKQQASAVALAASAEEQDELCRSAMRCGGCGGKVGASLLSRALLPLNVCARPDEVVCGLDAPDDCALLQLGGASPLVSTSVDFLRPIWRDEYVFARICANHAMGDVWAMGHSPVSAMCIAQVPAATSTKVRQRLSYMMAGAVLELNSARCALTAGHTTESSELMLGFSVLGQASSSQESVSLRKAPLASSFSIDDDPLVIILTKPIGTGAIMEAHMRLEAEGEWVKHALDSMLVSNAQASRILCEHGAVAMTDVTGFGLGGHLLEMMTAASAAAAGGMAVVARVEVDDVPYLCGALDALDRQQYASPLALSNEIAATHRVRHAFREEEDLLMVSLLFDPQTAGGLLAFVPRSQQAACLEQLRAGRYPHAACIGQLVPRQPGSSRVLVELV